MAIEIFFSYSHEDEKLREELEKQLSLLKWQGVISGWHDRRILAGQEWAHEIDKHFNTAQIILLLISPDFMASQYCYGIEVKRALERHERGEAKVIPVILRRVHWQGAPFGKLQALPTDGKPVVGASWLNQDEAFFNVAEGIRQVVEELSVKTLIEPPPTITSPSFAPPLDDSNDKVVVVAARNALPEYLKHCVYICQPNRAFQHCVRLAFYANGKIDRRVPRIIGQVEAINKEEIETRKDLTDMERKKLQQLLKNLERTRSNELSQKFKIMFLSSPDSPETLILPHDVVNNLISQNGRGTAFTQGQRYVSLHRLEKGPETTSELI